MKSLRNLHPLRKYSSAAIFLPCFGRPISYAKAQMGKQMSRFASGCKPSALHERRDTT